MCSLVLLSSTTLSARILHSFATPLLEYSSLPRMMRAFVLTPLLDQGFPLFSPSLLLSRVPRVHELYSPVFYLLAFYSQSISVGELSKYNFVAYSLLMFSSLARHSPVLGLCKPRDSSVPGPKFVFPFNRQLQVYGRAGELLILLKIRSYWS